MEKLQETIEFLKVLEDEIKKLKDTIKNKWKYDRSYYKRFYKCKKFKNARNYIKKYAKVYLKKIINLLKFYHNF